MQGGESIFAQLSSMEGSARDALDVQDNSALLLELYFWFWPISY